MDYLRAESPRKAVELLSRFKGKAALFAGGTDLLPGQARGKCAFEALIDIKGIKTLGGIKAQKSSVVLGPLVTLTDLATHRTIGRKLPVLARAASGMASPQVRNRGTLGGNLCNAAPSADLAPPLIALGARVRVLTRRGSRALDLEDFFRGPGETILTGGKGILTAVTIPLPKKGAAQSFHALTPREAMDLSVVSAAVNVTRQKGKVRKARLVLGAVAPVPLRCTKGEKELLNSPGGPEDIERAARACAKESRPIDDVRSSKAYRKEMAREMMVRALREVLA
jgi:carbon-monoxide dehydrogenase medium subunit